MSSTINQSELVLANFNEFAESLCDPMLNIRVDFDAQVTNKPIVFEIALDDLILSRQLIQTGSYQVVQQVQPKHAHRNHLCLTMRGKSPRDTVLDNGIIVADTYIKLKAFSINRFNLLTDYDFFAQEFRSVTADNFRQDPQQGFWNDSSLLLDFAMPFELWYQTKTTKNTQVAASLEHQASGDLGSARDRFVRSIGLLKS